MSVRRLDRDEIGNRGAAVYASKLRPLLEPKFRGAFVAIDIETEDYEVASDADVASDRLWERRPDAQILVERIGYPAAFHAMHMRTSDSAAMISVEDLNGRRLPARREKK